MFIPKWLLMDLINSKADLERRVKRIELMLLKEAETKITSLKDKNSAVNVDEKYSTIEEIINKRSMRR